MTYRDSRFTQITEAVAKAARHRKFHWCRRENGFSDMPLWREIAARLNLPVFQIVAFVNRLEEIANAADQRGSVEHFRAGEFGAALGMAADDAARIYAALEEPEIGWIAYDHVASFYRRNPDKEDTDNIIRQRRSRARKGVLKHLANLKDRGLVAPRDRDAIEISLKGLEDGELFALEAKLQLHVMRGEPLSTGHAGHIVTARDIVTVTPRADQKFQSGAGDNSVRSETGAAAGNQGVDTTEAGDSQSAAAAWLMSTGKRMLVDHLQINPTLAETYIERWRRDLQDDAALQTIMEGADKAGYIGARFHTLITDGVKRHLHAVKTGGQALLPLPPAVIAGAKKGAA